MLVSTTDTCVVFYAVYSCVGLRRCVLLYEDVGMCVVCVCASCLRVSIFRLLCQRIMLCFLCITRHGVCASAGIRPCLSVFSFKCVTQKPKRARMKITQNYFFFGGWSERHLLQEPPAWSKDACVLYLYRACRMPVYPLTCLPNYGCFHMHLHVAAYV